MSAWASSAATTMATATASAPRLLEPPQASVATTNPYPTGQGGMYSPGHRYAQSDPYLAATHAVSTRRFSGPETALIPFDHAVRLERQRTVRGSSTTELATWPESCQAVAGPAPFSTPPTPSQSQSRGASAPALPPTVDRSPSQRTPTRKLTKHRRTSSGTSQSPASPTWIPYTPPPPPHLSPARSEWTPTPLQVAPASPNAASPYPPRPSPPQPRTSSYFSSDFPSPHPTASWTGYQNSPQAVTTFPSNFQHLSPYPPARPPLPPLPGRTESEEQQVRQLFRLEAVPDQPSTRADLVCLGGRWNVRVASPSRPSRLGSLPSPQRKTTSSTSRSPSRNLSLRASALGSRPTSYGRCRK